MRTPTIGHNCIDRGQYDHRSIGDFIAPRKNAMDFIEPFHALMHLQDEGQTYLVRYILQSKLSCIYKRQMAKWYKSIIKSKEKIK